MTRDLPTSTYRYQISQQFTLDDAAADLPRLVELGIDAVYLSPVLTATTGSDHGYDWVDCRQVDPQRGGEEGWDRFVRAAQQAQLKVVLDIVPNHCGISDPAQNPFWWSVLSEGRDSQYAHWFDIDWSRAPILLPVLGEDGDLSSLSLSEAADELRLGGLRLPTAPGSANPGDDPREVAGRQHYRLAPWPLASTELNYRRFFTVDSLAGLRIEDERVFEATHERIFAMVDRGEVQGLRVDHPDGLSDPGEYFRRLRARVGDSIWLLAEKILGDGEPLPDWPIDGTSGYDALAEVNRLFTKPDNEAYLTNRYQLLTGDHLSAEDHVLVGKRTMIDSSFGSEVTRILRTLPEPVAAGFEPDRLRAALAEVAVHVPVYRSYLPQVSGPLDAALAVARRTRADLVAEIDALAPSLADVTTEAARRFEQLTGALTAKGLEDTAWYRYSRFIGANEVGGHPSRFATTLDGFHADMAHRQQEQPFSMTTLSTHDTKRSEDIRAWLAAMTEFPERVSGWLSAFLQAGDIPDGPLAYLLGQTLAATGPIQPERLHAYATKAMREAGVHTSWTEPDEQFEQLVHDAIELAYTSPELEARWQALGELLAAPAVATSLSQKLVQLTMPGIPDVYWGTEVFDDSLVDPDNRRLPDFDRLREAAHSPLVIGHPNPDHAKHWVVEHALRLRRAAPELFTGYEPLVLGGPLSAHLVAFNRGGAVTLATRMPATLARAGGWGEASLTLDGTWTDVLSGRRTGPVVRLAEVLEHLPVALLVKD
ncbi:malto-oligosyltrehalose synthase [Propionibacteriaceae bacterium Y1923]